MTEDETAELLGFASNYDHRHITDEETAAWYQALRWLDLDEAMAAVAEHYQGSSSRVMPADVLRYARPPASRHPSSLPVPARLDVSSVVAGRGARRAFEAVEQARAANQARRERVLRHPDLARRLTEPPLGYSRPEQWNGYVPPAEIQDEVPEGLHSSALDGGFPNQHGKRSGGTRPNMSPRRAALVDICAEALRREQEEV